ncbi:MAG TPA: dihydropteroate synthase [Spirochaetota bacterium]|nr:dihydropteroate synthase [Spirochaetota bacterium]
MYTDKCFKLKTADNITRSIAAPALMGIINTTPDSFYSPSRTVQEKEILLKAEEFMKNNAAFIDVGGESSRPGAVPVPVKTEIKRVVPAITVIKKHFPDILLSIDTCKVETAMAALDAGADLINDISAGTYSDDKMFSLAVQNNVPLILMHKKGNPADMQHNPSYQNTVKEIIAYLKTRIKVFKSYGADNKRIIIDPGIGFGKNRQHNLDILQHIGKFKRTGYPLLIGASMKRIVGDLTGASVNERLAGSIGLNLAAAAMGCDILRVHDIKSYHHSLITYYAVSRI